MEINVLIQVNPFALLVVGMVSVIITFKIVIMPIVKKTKKIATISPKQ